MTAGLTVAAAMLRRPRLCDPAATVAEVRRTLGDEHVHAALIVRGGRLIAMVERADLPESGGDELAAIGLGRLAGRVISPDAGLAVTQQWMLETGRRRLAVIDDQKTLLGLLCLKRTGTGFCTDADVLARARAGGPDSAATAVLRTARLGRTR